MAKAKKTESTPAAPEKKAAATKAPAKKAPVKKAAAPSAQPAGVPMIDTNLAAQNAATMLRNRAATTPAAQSGGKETSAFKSMKDQLAKPRSASLSNLLGAGSDSKKAGGHFNAHQQKGHNQTFGGLNKTGVPRRTNG